MLCGPTSGRDRAGNCRLVHAGPREPPWLASCHRAHIPCLQSNVLVSLAGMIAATRPANWNVFISKILALLQILNFLRLHLS